MARRGAWAATWRLRVCSSIRYTHQLWVGVRVSVGSKCKSAMLCYSRQQYGLAVRRSMDVWCAVVTCKYGRALLHGAALSHVGHVGATSALRLTLHAAAHCCNTRHITHVLTPSTVRRMAGPLHLLHLFQFDAWEDPTQPWRPCSISRNLPGAAPTCPARLQPNPVVPLKRSGGIADATSCRHEVSARLSTLET